MSMLVSGSRFPVGSSAISSGGWLTNARAIETRCCSPPELVREVVQLGRQAGQPEDVGDLGPNLLARATCDLKRVGDVVVDGPVRQQLEVLEHDPDVPAVIRNAPSLDLGQVTAGHADRSLGRIELLDQQPHDRRLARARAADEEHEVLAVDREGRLIEADVAGRVALRDAPELDHRLPARGAADDLSRMRGGGDDGAPSCPLLRLFRGSHLSRAAYRACRLDVRSFDRLQCYLQD